LNPRLAAPTIGVVGLVVASARAAAVGSSVFTDTADWSDAITTGAELALVACPFGLLGKYAIFYF
jgi:hypothetical protein